VVAEVRHWRPAAVAALLCCYQAAPQQLVLVTPQLSLLLAEAAC
jgi:hypothetical protein